MDLLAKPFRSDTFDFADPAFMKAIYDLGEESRGLGKCCGFCLWLTRRMARPPFLGKCGLAPGRERQNPRHIGEKTQSGGR